LRTAQYLSASIFGKHEIKRKTVFLYLPTTPPTSELFLYQIGQGITTRLFPEESKIQYSRKLRVKEFGFSNMINITFQYAKYHF
jgi:hypothetical protein